MKDKIKKVFKSRIFLCILTALLTGTVSVYAVTYFPSNQVTYDNKTSGLKSSDVQGAIDELYNTCSSAAQSGDYVYYAVGSYEDGSSVGDPQIYRVSVDGEEMTTLIYTHEARNATNIESMYVTQDYIYYAVGSYEGGSSVGDPQIYRVSVDGEEMATLIYTHETRSGANIEGMYVTQDYIYYAVGSYEGSNSKSDSKIYRVSIDGEGMATLIYTHEARNATNIESMFIR